MGTNRDAGKTTLACDIIRKFSSKLPVSAIKISPHFHPLEDNEEIIEKNVSYIIVREWNTSGNKDSARMKQAGADQVFYLQVLDDHLADAIQALDQHIKYGNLVVCESGWVRSIVKPGLFLMMHREGEKMLKANAERFRPLVDRFIIFNGSEFDFSPEEIFIDDLRWRIK